jgi:hypothetical protein
MHIWASALKRNWACQKGCCFKGLELIPVSRAMLLKYVTAAMRASRVIERRLLVVTNWFERGVLVRSIGCIARDDRLEQKEAHDRCNNDDMFAERFPNEPRPEDEGALGRQARTAPRRMLEPQHAAPKRMHIFEFGRGRKVDERLDESTALRLLPRGVGASPYASGWN